VPKVGSARQPPPKASPIARQTRQNGDGRADRGRPLSCSAIFEPDANATASLIAVHLVDSSGICVSATSQDDKELTMKKFFAAAAFAAISLSAGAANAAPVTAEAGAGAKIIAPLEIKNTAPLYFGTIAPSLTESGLVYVTPEGEKKCEDALTCLTADHTAAKFEVRGEADAAYTISLPDGVEITNEKGDAMKVFKFWGSKDGGRLAKGQDSFTVGGVLNVEARQAAGQYTGRFIVAVEYQ
jgi:hypothetical protein